MIVKRHYVCNGCGDRRKCRLETNQEKNKTLGFLDPIDDMKCVLDDTNQTSFNWVEEHTPTSDNSDYAASPKLPSFEDVMRDCYVPSKSYTSLFKGVYNSIKKLGNFA